MTKYDRNTRIQASIEIRLTDPFGNGYVLFAWADDRGGVSHSFGTASGGGAHSLSGLQSKETYPRKAVAGWQREFIDFVKAGIYTVTEIR